MGYFKDSIDLIRLDDEAYRRVAGDEKALSRVIKIDLMTAYPLVIIAFIVAGFFLMIFDYAIAQGEAGSFTQSLGVMAIFAALVPPLIVLAFYIAYMIPHYIGKRFGGESKYNDFYKTIRYPQPVLGRLATMIGFGIVPAVYHFFILYKTYTNVMGIEPGQAKKAVWWNVGLFGALVAVMVLAVVYGVMRQAL